MNGLIIGFTGTRNGLSKAQQDTIETILTGYHVEEFHHGDCVGGDAQAHAIAVSCGIPVIIHPPTQSNLRAWCKGAKEVCEPYPYLARNRHIVESCDTLIACPASLKEEIRSGTWFTVRYARNVGKTVILIGPDGVQR